MAEDEYRTTTELGKMIKVPVGTPPAVALPRHGPRGFALAGRIRRTRRPGATDGVALDL